MKLAVNQFYEYRPASQWAFDITFSNPMVVSKKSNNGVTYQLESTNTFTQSDLERISQAVVSCTQPKFDIEPYTETYGNFDFVVPLYDVNNIRLTITFEDTDDCLISYKLLSSLMGGSTANKVPAWLNIHETILIGITEYKTYQYDATRPNSYQEQFRNWNNTVTKLYFCKLVEYTEPNYNRTSDNPQATTLKLTFLAVPAQVVMLNNSPIITGGVEEVDLKSELHNIVEDVKRLFGNIKFTGSILAGAFQNADIAAYTAQAQEWIKQHYADGKVTLSRLQEWVKNDVNIKLYSNGATGNCAAGVSLLISINNYANGTGTAEYKARGNGNNYNADTTDIHKNLTTEDIDKAAANLKPGQSFIVRFGATTDHPNGHVVIVSKDSTGKQQYTSDFNQASWRTYSDLSTQMSQNGMVLDILDYEHVVTNNSTANSTTELLKN
jgi:hypothetical protein